MIFDYKIKRVAREKDDKKKEETAKQMFTFRDMGLRRETLIERVREGEREWY